MTPAEIREAFELLDDRKAIKLSPEEAGEILSDKVWAVMRSAGQAYIDHRLKELGVECTP